MAIVEIEGLDKPSSLSNEQSVRQPAIKVAGFYTEQTRKLAAGCSKHCFEVVDRTDEVSSKYYFEVTDGS